MHPNGSGRSTGSGPNRPPKAARDSALSYCAAIFIGQPHLRIHRRLLRTASQTSSPTNESDFIPPENFHQMGLAGRLHYSPLYLRAALQMLSGSLRFGRWGRLRFVDRAWVAGRMTVGSALMPAGTGARPTYMTIMMEQNIAIRNGPLFFSLTHVCQRGRNRS